MALLSTSQLGTFLNAVPFNFNVFGAGGAALTNQVLVAAAAVPAGSSLAVTALQIRSDNAVGWSFVDSGATNQLIVKTTAAVAREFTPSPQSPVLICNPSTGLNLTTTADPGNWDVTLVVRIVPGLT